VSAAVERLGGLDVLVSNAAAGAFGHMLEVDADDFDRAVDVTFGGTVNVIRAALPHLRASCGVIVAAVSLLNRVPMPSWTAYAAAKHALRGFLNSLRVEGREQRSGARIAMVHPRDRRHAVLVVRVERDRAQAAGSSIGRTPRAWSRGPSWTAPRARCPRSCSAAGHWCWTGRFCSPAAAPSGRWSRSTVGCTPARNPRPSRLVVAVDPAAAGRRRRPRPRERCGHGRHTGPRRRGERPAAPPRRDGPQGGGAAG
jgi:NAD(P)-dependent dehydrogenase (short-subunit alcohol dehydrogenase family)